MGRLGFLHNGAYGIHPLFHWGVLVIGLLLLAGIVTLAVLAFRHHEAPYQYRRPFPHGPRDDAERIVRERLARGEITEDEYRATLATLRDHP